MPAATQSRVCRRPLAILCAPALLTAGLLLAPGFAQAGTISTSAPPNSGLEAPDTPMKGRKLPAVGGMMDAYGNPITGEIPEKAPKKRLPAGAYGGYGKKAERPLPDPQDDRPVW